MLIGQTIAGLHEGWVEVGLGNWLIGGLEGLGEIIGAVHHWRFHGVHGGLHVVIHSVDGLWVVVGHDDGGFSISESDRGGDAIFGHGEVLVSSFPPNNKANDDNKRHHATHYPSRNGPNRPWDIDRISRISQRIRVLPRAIVRILIITRDTGRRTGPTKTTAPRRAVPRRAGTLQVVVCIKGVFAGVREVVPVFVDATGACQCADTGVGAAAWGAVAG